jgi:hypothetical protein
VEVDETRDGVSQNTHKSIAPSTLNHLEGEPLGDRRDLLPADLTNDLEGQLPSALLKESVTSNLWMRASETRGQLHQVMLKHKHVLVGIDLMVSGRSVHLHKILR